MTVVTRILRDLIGDEATQKIINHPNLHVVSLPEETVQDLVEGSSMIVPVGVLCDLCDLPARNRYCECLVESVTDDEGFTMTTKRRKNHGEDKAALTIVEPPR